MTSDDKIKKEKLQCDINREIINYKWNCENVPNLEINEVVLVHCNIVNNNY